MVSLLTVFEETNTPQELSKPHCLETQGTEEQTSYLHTNTTGKRQCNCYFQIFLSAHSAPECACPLSLSLFSFWTLLLN